MLQCCLSYNGKTRMMSEKLDDMYMHNHSDMIMMILVRQMDRRNPIDITRLLMLTCVTTSNVGKTKLKSKRLDLSLQQYDTSVKWWTICITYLKLVRWQEKVFSRLQCHDKQVQCGQWRVVSRLHAEYLSSPLQHLLRSQCVAFHHPGQVCDPII